MVTNKLGDVLAHTDAFDRLMRPTGLLESIAPNFMRYLFTDFRARSFFSNWDQVADIQLFDLWHAPTVTAAEWLKAEIAPLGGADFAAKVTQKLLPAPRPWEIAHPEETQTRWQREVLEIPAEPEQQCCLSPPTITRERPSTEPDSTTRPCSGQSEARRTSPRPDCYQPVGERFTPDWRGAGTARRFPC
jgi:hypothetical protein